MSIFTFVILAATGIFISVIKSQRSTLGLQESTDNIRFATEAMAKAIRMSDIVTKVSGSTIEINHPTKGSVIYSLEEGRIKENGQPITSEKVQIENLFFEISGAEATDNLQPRITIFIQGRSGSSPSINLQTTISQRNIQ
jgi:hypothetical protein